MEELGMALEDDLRKPSLEMEEQKQEQHIWEGR